MGTPIISTAADKWREHARSWFGESHAPGAHETAQLQRSQRVQSGDRWVMPRVWGKSLLWCCIST